MIKNELITIGVTCFNAQSTIVRALKSAVMQSWEPKEILVVDDASSDQSAEVIACYAKQHPHIRLIQHKSNTGASGARQTILEHSKGAFIAFFDDDDESAPQRLEKQHARICAYEKQTQETLVACYASGQRVYPNGVTVHLDAIGSKPDVPWGEAVVDRFLFFGGNNRFFYGSGVPTCSLMARKSTFDAVGGFDSSFRRVEDVDFAVRLALQGAHFIGCQSVLFTQHATQTEDKAPEKNRDAEVLLVEKHKAYLQGKRRYIYAKKWPLLRYYHFKKQYIRLFAVLLELILRYPVKTLSHFLTTAPKRFFHERKIRKKGSTGG